MSTVSDESSEQMSSSQTRPVHMNEDEVAACRQVFNIVDEDGSGSIGAQELHRLLKLLRLPATEEEVLRMIAEVDEDGNGEVEFAEFVQVCGRDRLVCQAGTDNKCRLSDKATGVRMSERLPKKVL